MKLPIIESIYNEERVVLKVECTIFVRNELNFTNLLNFGADVCICDKYLTVLVYHIL